MQKIRQRLLSQKKRGKTEMYNTKSYIGQELRLLIEKLKENPMQSDGYILLKIARIAMQDKEFYTKFKTSEEDIKIIKRAIESKIVLQKLKMIQSLGYRKSKSYYYLTMAIADPHVEIKCIIELISQMKELEKIHGTKWKEIKLTKKRIKQLRKYAEDLSYNNPHWIELYKPKIPDDIERWYNEQVARGIKTIYKTRKYLMHKQNVAKKLQAAEQMDTDTPQ